MSGLLALMAGILVVHMLPYRYMAEAVVRPPDQGGVKIGGGVAASLGKGLLGGGGDIFSGADQTSFDEFTLLLDSNTLSQWLVTNHPEILHHIYSGKWDEKAHRWKNGGLGEAIKNGVRAILGVPYPHAPTAADLRRFLNSNVAVTTDLKSGMLTIAYEDRDPEFARQLILWMHEGADTLVREEVKARAQRRIAYLSKLLPTVSQTDLHSILIQQLAQEEQQLMTTEADIFYAALPVDPPIVAQRPSFPPSLKILFLSMLLGMVATVAYLAYVPQLGLSERFKFDRIQFWRRGRSSVDSAA